MEYTAQSSLFSILVVVVVVFVDDLTLSHNISSSPSKTLNESETARCTLGLQHAGCFGGSGASTGCVQCQGNTEKHHGSDDQRQVSEVMFSSAVRAVEKEAVGKRNAAFPSSFLIA